MIGFVGIGFHAIAELIITTNQNVVEYGAVSRPVPV